MYSIAAEAGPSPGTAHMILAQAFSRFAFDLDGVIWRGQRPVDGSIETVRALAQAGKRLCYVTNNSSEPAEAVAARLAQMGAPSDPSLVLTSADAVAKTIQERVSGARGRLACVLGGPGLREAAERVGMRVASEAEAHLASIVLVGLDKEFTYDRLRAATLAIRSGAVLIASNADPTYPVEDVSWPGAGAILAAVVAATGATPIVAGKPHPGLFGLAERVLGGAPALAIGDRVETDVAAAHAAGWAAALVLTGAASLATLATADDWPDFLLRRPSDLLLDLPHGQLRPATGGDLANIASLLHRAKLRSGGARERLGRTVIVEAERDRPIATAAIDTFSDIGILRSVASSDGLSGQGAGTLAVAGAMRLGARAGARRIFVSSATAGGFFERLGFAEIDRRDLPDAMLDAPGIERDWATAPIYTVALA